MSTWKVVGAYVDDKRDVALYQELKKLSGSTHTDLLDRTNEIIIPLIQRDGRHRSVVIETVPEVKGDKTEAASNPG
jgi:hypothetical protein